MRTLAMASIFLGTVVLGTAAASAQYDPSLAASWNKRDRRSPTASHAQHTGEFKIGNHRPNNLRKL
jgi:hypothetical protein